MSFRGNQNNRNRNFGGGNYGNSSMGANRMGNMNMSPWETQNIGGGFGGGNIRQAGVGGQGMNAQALNLANNLLNNLFRNQNPPSLLDLPRGGGGGGGGSVGGNRSARGGQLVNRSGSGNRFNNRRVSASFLNRGAVVGPKTAVPKQSLGGIRKQNAFDRAKKLLSKNATSAKKKEFTPNEKKESKESVYASVPNDMFYCHLCKKHMWDANSFENHIKGRTHLMMREGIEESYRLKANMIRQEAKIAEQLKSIELDRLKRMGKSKQRQLEYCTMCDLNFHGNLSAHRKSEGHLILKKFLHPKCPECTKEFPTRIDFDSHLLSAEHLKRAAEKNTKVGERKKATLTIHTEEEEQKDVRPPQKRNKKKSVKKGDAVSADIKKETAEAAEGEEVEEETEKKDEGIDESKEDDGAEGAEAGEEEEEIALPVDPEDCIIDYAEGDEIPPEVENRLPKYNYTRPVGFGMINKLECYECFICGKFLDNEKTAEVHSRTQSHHRNFLRFINEKSSDTKIAQKRAAAAQEESEKKKRKIEELENTTTNTEESGCVETVIKSENGEDQVENAKIGDINEGELYDPSEATGDDEDVEMADNGNANLSEDAVAENGNEMVGVHEEENESVSQPEVSKDEVKPDPVKKSPTKVVPVAPAASAESTPAKKATTTRGGAKPNARGRGGRGRYARY